MRAVTGTFRSLADGTRAAHRLEPLIGADHVNLLTPESSRAEVKAVPTMDSEQPVAAPIGATLGGALGIAAAVLIPGVGPVTALGAAAAALFAAAGGALGWTVGGAADRALTTGLEADELYFYEDALREGRTVLVALVDDPDREPLVRDILNVAGAESIDAARERWWLGLRDAEAEHYGGGAAEGDDSHERLYRYGFTAGLTGVPAAARPHELQLWQHLDEHERSVVQRGFERGAQTRRATRAGDQARLAANS